jgi:predicted DsbA family dithiol-disulfide isomerase
VREAAGYRLAVNWKYFSLEQVNSQPGPQRKLWEQPADYASRGLPAFRAAAAARRQGEEHFISFHMALLKAKHAQGRDIADIGTLSELARGAGLEMIQFERDFNHHSILASLAEDHTLAVETLGIFGTPTLVFPEGKPIFLKLASPPPPSQSPAVFDEVRLIAERREYIAEIKRP